MEEIMLKIDNVSKQYKLGQIGGTTLRDELQRFSAKLHHREDPTKKIGAKDYNKGETFMALDGVSFTVKKGERVGIIGHNGAGKSTLLKLISRVTAPTGGSISLNGRVASMLEVGTGFHGELTGRENIYMNGAILGMTKKEIDAKMEDIIEFSECRQFIDTPVKRYSSGMYVKLAFSVAAHLDSEIMIMDEVLAVGDMAFQKKCLQKMSDVSKSENRTILYVSHNMNTIRQLCDRCVVLDHGKVVFDGGVEEGISLYMGTTDWNQLPVFYDVSQKERNCNFGRIVFIRSMELFGKSNAIYDFKEDIQLLVKLTTQKELDNVQIVVRIKDDTNASIVASCLSEPFSIKTDKINNIKMTIKTDALLYDNYCLTLEVIQNNVTGSQYISYDNPDKAIPISIVNNFTDDFNWSKQYWGNVILPFGQISVME